ncbi:MAG: DUF4838 domain-containing protein [Clostridia bacterium]|nr:DUF4838 domain-containing protein [Clostridia bacterium]
MKKWMTLCLASLLLFSSCTACKNNSLENNSEENLIEIQELVKNNHSPYSVVIPVDASECIEYAASELLDFVYESSGVSLNVISESEASYSEGNCYISLGKTELLNEAKFAFDYSTLNGDGFFIKTVGNMVFIDANLERGVLYGVYDFLEKNLGVRFLTQDCTYIPKLNTIKLYETDDVEVPDFMGRLYLSAPTYKSWGVPEFVARTRQDSSYLSYVDDKYGEKTLAFLREGRNHNMSAFVDYETYSETHSEFFVEVPPEYEKYGDTWRMICLTNGITDDGKLDETMEVSVAKIVIEEMKKDILANPDAYYFGFEQSDGYIYCTCDRCVDAWNKYKASGVLIRFCNVVAEEIENDFKEAGIERDFRINTFAYAYTLDAPVKVQNGEWIPIDDSVVANEKIVIKIAQGRNVIVPYLSEDKDSSNAQRMQQWQKCATQFQGWVHDKDYNDYISYYPALGTIKQSMLNMKEAGFTNILIQAAHNETYDWQSDLRGYIYRNLLWDVDLDVETLFNEFVELYWGKTVAPYVKEMITAYEQLYAIALAKDPELQIKTSQTEYLDPTKGFIDLNFLNDMMTLMKEARVALEANEGYTTSEKNVYRQRIAMAQTSPMFTTVRFYAKYFPDSSVQEMQRYYTEFFNLADEAGITLWYEIKSLATYKKELGVS